MTHCGSRLTPWEDVEKVETPPATETWNPIPHAELVGGITAALNRAGLKIIQAAHALGRDGLRYFGLMQVTNGKNSDDYGLVVGLRNSHDKSFPAGLVVGSGVFVCDNLAFSGEIKLARKHTRHIVRDLPNLIQRAVGRLGGLRQRQEQRIDAYKRVQIGDTGAHDLIIQALDARVISASRIPHIVKEWRSPRHPEFRDGKTVWRLFNAFTETMKESPIFQRPRTTQALHGLMDSVSGIATSTN